MASQARLNHDTTPLVLANGKQESGFTVAQYVTGVIPKGTVLGQVTAGGKLLPITNVAAADGTKFPKYITLDEIDATAGDVTNVTVLKAGSVADINVNLENSLTLDDFITLGTNFAVTIKQALQLNGLIVESAGYIDEYENA